MQIAEVSESPVYSCNQKQGKSIEKEASFCTNSVIHFCYSTCVITHHLVLKKKIKSRDCGEFDVKDMAEFFKGSKRLQLFISGNEKQMKQVRGGKL